MNDRNEIILNVSLPSLSTQTYNTLVRGKADGSALEALTLFPETSSYFPSRNEVLIYNHFGTYSYDGDSGNWQELSFLPSFSSGESLSPLSLKALEMSPDGRYAAYIREDEGQGASLILYDRDRDIRLTVSSRLKREYLQDMLQWSPDSRYFIYRRGRDLYYFSIDQYLSGRIPAESFRHTGFRDIQSLRWKSGNYLYILKERHLYRIHSSEFFTRSFYSEPFRRGTVRGRLPVAYDPEFDSFILNDSGTSLLLLKDGRHCMVIHFSDARGAEPGQTPLLNLSSGDRILKAAWLEQGTLLLLARNGGSGESLLYSYQPDESSSFTLLRQGDLTGFSVSPGGARYALFSGDSVEIFEEKQKTAVLSYRQNKVRQLHWGKDQYYSMGTETLRTVDPRGGSTRIIGLSQNGGAGFTAGGDLICRSGDSLFRYNEALDWIALKGDTEIRSPRQTTDQYRIYLEDLRGGWYSSSLKVRNVESYYTSDFIPLFRGRYESDVPFRLRPDSRSNPWYFDHGQSSDSKELSIVINAVDSAEGITPLLDTLDAYGIGATFFINGDFIHANPGETMTIAESGHTVGSLFYTWFDLSDPAYQIDKTFLKKGLARNEDDYFIATGHEMAMLWHTPNYYINSAILETSASMQYVFIGTDVPVQDRISRNNAVSYNAVEEAENLLMRIRPGSLISLTLGRELGQDEYLIQTLPMILDELLREGYEFVDLQEMMRSSRQ